MEELISRLSELNRLDPDWEYSIEIKPSGAFVLHGLAADSIFNKILRLPEKKKYFPCVEFQDLIDETERILLNLRK